MPITHNQSIGTTMTTVFNSNQSTTEFHWYWRQRELWTKKAGEFIRTVRFCFGSIDCISIKFWFKHTKINFCRNDSVSFPFTSLRLYHFYNIFHNLFTFIGIFFHNFHLIGCNFVAMFRGHEVIDDLSEKNRTDHKRSVPHFSSHCELRESCVFDRQRTNVMPYNREHRTLGSLWVCYMNWNTNMLTNTLKTRVWQKNASTPTTF